MLCGVHCINALLQGPFFDEIQMAQIANAIDEEEQALMGGRDTQGLRKGQVSHNVANDGNFSIQVLQKALLQFGGIQCIPLANKEVQQSIRDYTEEKAFICHSVDHWLAIRKVHGVWYNLNSTNMVPPGP